MKFSIRDLFLVTVIVAVVLGWWVDHHYLELQVSEFSWKVKALENAADFLGFDTSFDDGGIDFEATSSRQGYKYSFVSPKMVI